MTRIFLGQNYFGAGNLGDDLTLAGFLQASAQAHVAVSACTSFDLASQQRRFPQIRWLPDEPAARDEALREADVWVALGDTPFQLDSGPWSLDHNERERHLCAALGKPMYWLGVGCESREAAADPRTRSLLASATGVWTRDANSTDLLRPFAGDRPIETGADLAHLVFTHETPALERDRLGLLLAFERCDQFDLSELSRWIARFPPQTIRWLIQEVRELPHLERWILAALDPTDRGSLCVTNVDYATVSIAAFLRDFGAPEVVISSRYHGALIAAWHGSRLAVVARSAKLNGLATDLGVPQVDRFASATDADSALERATVVSRAQLDTLHERAASMCSAFFLESGRERRPALRSDALPHRSLRAKIEMTIPDRLSAGETVALPCVVTNRSRLTYLSAPPHPIEICYRWYDMQGAAVGSGTWLHTPLPKPLIGGASTEVTARIAAPPDPGSYTLAVTLLQEQVAWFDDLDPDSAARASVRVLDVADRVPDAPDDGEKFYALDADVRRAMTRESIETRTPLLIRWGQINRSWENEWGGRAAIAADWLRPSASVADFGCGGMNLERHLQPAQRYVPLDIVARDHRTIVFDLEKNDLAIVDADAYALLGVIEYLFDVPRVLANLHDKFQHGVISYNICSDGAIERRLEHGWVNHFSLDDLRSLFERARLEIRRERAIDGSQVLFELASLS